MPYFPVEKQRKEVAYGYMPEEFKEANRVIEAGEEKARQAAMTSLRRKGDES